LALAALLDLMVVLLERTEETPCLAQLLVWVVDTVVLLLLLAIPVALVAAAAPAHRDQLQAVLAQQGKVTTVARVELTLHRFRLEVVAVQAQSARQPQY
jgi:hypothetical protein